MIVVRMAGRFGRCARRRSPRSASQKSTTDPESARPYSSSGPVHHALSGTTTAPIDAAAQNATDHSGKFRMAMATRSPGRTPWSSTSRWARVAAVRKCPSKLRWSSS